MFLPVVIMSFYYGEFLTKIGVDKNVADMSEHFVKVYLPGSLFNTYVDSLDMLFIATENSLIVAIIMTSCLPFAGLFCWLFVLKLEFGLVGAALAHDLTAIITLTVTLVYFKCKNGLNQACFLPSMRIFTNLLTFLKTAMPGMLMLLLENSNM